MLESQLPKREVITVSPLYRWLTIIFALLSLIISGFILSSILGKSTIVVSPKTEEINLPFTLAIYKEFKSETEQAGIIANIFETNLEKDILVSLPKTQATSTRATGVVTIVNKSNKEQTLVASTQLMAENNKIYRLSKTVVSIPGKEIIVSVSADKDGEGYDIGKSKLTVVKLRDDLKPLIYATTDKINREISGEAEVNEATVNSGLEEAKKQLANSLISELKKSGPINEKTISVNFYRQTFDIKTINKSGDLIYTIGATAKATTVSNQDIANVVAQNLPTEIKDKFAIVDPTKIDYQTEYTNNNSHELGLIKGSAKIGIANLKISKSELTGKSIDEVKKILYAAGANEVNIVLPFWQNKLPRLSNNIDIQLKK